MGRDSTHNSDKKTDKRMPLFQNRGGFLKLPDTLRGQVRAQISAQESMSDIRRQADDGFEFPALSEHGAVKILLADRRHQQAAAMYGMLFPVQFPRSRKQKAVRDMNVASADFQSAVAGDQQEQMDGAVKIKIIGKCAGRKIMPLQNKRFFIGQMPVEKVGFHKNCSF